MFGYKALTSAISISSADQSNQSVLPSQTRICRPIKPQSCPASQTNPFFPVKPGPAGQSNHLVGPVKPGPTGHSNHSVLASHTTVCLPGEPRPVDHSNHSAAQSNDSLLASRTTMLASITRPCWPVKPLHAFPSNESVSICVSITVLRALS